MRATELSAHLAARAQEVCAYLLPGGRVVAGEWCCGSVNGEAGDSCKVKLTGAKAGVWQDFGGSAEDKGDLIGLWKRVRNVDLSQACQQAIEWLGLPREETKPTHLHPVKPIETRAPSETWIKLQERLRPGTREELAAVAKLRKLPNVAGLEAATENGQLWFGKVWDDGFEYPSWILTDGARRNAQARKLDGSLWSMQAKAKTIKGCEARWPVGIAEADDAPELALVEGGPDLLACWSYIVAQGKRGVVVPVTMFGASNAIHPEALPKFAGKKVWLFPHGDEAGAKAARAWSEELRGVGSRPETFDLSGHGVKDLNDLLTAGKMPALFEEADRSELDLDGETLVEAHPQADPDAYQPLPQKSLDDFKIMPRDDNSVLLGNRFLNRGDGAVLVSTSGMGKSSMAMQCAVLWALGRDAFGIKPNGCLKSLIIQSEDSDGDVAEVWGSILHLLKLTPEERAKVILMVKVVTDRVHRGLTFVKEVRVQIEIAASPDIVWVNPLAAFIGGDVSKAEDAGVFLREQLNGLNEPPRFGWFVVTHTTKPPTDKGKSERKWNEVMYDMAGSYDLIGWARAILSLRATPEPGEFDLVLAKRGSRAEVRIEKKSDSGLPMYERTNVIPLKHAEGEFVDEKTGLTIPLVFWLPREVKASEQGKTIGRPRRHSFEDFASIFPLDSSKAQGLRVLHRFAREIKSIGNNAFEAIIDNAVIDGILIKDKSNPRQPKYYLNGGPK